MNKILIEVRGGVIQNIIATGDMEIYAINYNGGNEEEFFSYYQSNGDQQITAERFDAILRSIEDDEEIKNL
jgi:hypothetical protein